MTNAPAPKPAPISKPCPKCGNGTLVERENRANGSHFLGCTSWPLTCSHTEPIPEYFRQLKAGASVLPGFDLYPPTSEEPPCPRT